MAKKTATVKQTLRRLLLEGGRGPIDLVPLHVAAGRPRGRSPRDWAKRMNTGGEIFWEAAGQTSAAMADRVIAREYAHYLDRSIEPAYWNRETLKSRGWTDSLIRSFLEVPDATRAGFRSKSDIKLYLVGRVEKIESRPSFRKALVESADRKLAARKAVATKRKTILDEVEGFDFPIPILDREKLTQDAMASFRSMNDGHEPSDLDRAIVNYIRHELTGYEEKLRAIESRVGTREAYLTLSEKLFDAIEDAYSWLADECHRQMKARYDRDLAWTS